MHSSAPDAPSLVTMRCDPWSPIVTRLAFCLICGGLGIDNALTFSLWTPDPRWRDGLLGAALIAVGIWSVVAWLSSRLTIDRANNRLQVKRFTFWNIGDGEPRVVPLDAIAAVVLTPQRRVQLLKPKRIELRLRDGEKIPVSNSSLMTGALAVYGQQLADAIDCSYEEQERPDKR